MELKNGLITSLDGLKLIQYLIPTNNKKARPQTKMMAEYITIHNTGNPNASALANSKYVANVDSYISWHFTVGNNEVYQNIPITEIAWHAGDGENGLGNRKSIGIEIAEVDGAEETAIKFVAQLIKLTGIPIQNVVPHQHWSGKYCPRLILPHWDIFVENIKKELHKEDIKVVNVQTVVRYKKFEDIPEFYKPYVQKWMDAGVLKGDDLGELNLTEEMIRNLIITERMLNLKLNK